LSFPLAQVECSQKYYKGSEDECYEIIVRNKKTNLTKGKDVFMTTGA
jgi:hypothetical protein